jgi:hypothetical protein
VAKKQIAKHWTAAVIDTGNLAIEDGTFNAKMFGNPPSEFCKAAEDISIPGDQFTPVYLDMRE